MKDFDAVYDITVTLHAHLQDSHLPQDREAYIDTLHSLLDEREILIRKVDSKITIDPEKLQQLLQLDAELNERMDVIKNTIGNEIILLKRQKGSRNQYGQVNQSVSFNGMYYDKKK